MSTATAMALGDVERAVREMDLRVWAARDAAEEAGPAADAERLWDEVSMLEHAQLPMLRLLRKLRWEASRRRWGR